MTLRRPNIRANRRAINANGVFDPYAFFHTSNGCRLWLRADLGITLNGTDVSAWADQSGSGNHATQGTAANQPAYSASDANFAGHASVTGDGTADYMDANGASTFLGAAADRGYTVFASLRWVTRTNGDRPFGWGSSSAGGSYYGTYYASATQGQHVYRNTITGSEFLGHDFTTNVNNGNAHVWSLEDTGTAQDFWVDGVRDPSAPGAINASAPNTLDRFTLFAYTLGSVASHGNLALCEIAIMDHTVKRPNDAERRAVERYMAARVGVTVT